MEKRRKSLCCRLMVALICSICCASSYAVAQQKLDQAAVEQWRADLRYLAEELPRRHKNLFAAMTREQFEQAVKRLDERIPTLDPPQIFVEMLRIVAQVKDGHTRITKRDPSGFAFRRYPLRLFLYRDGLFVQEAAPELARAVGGRVVKIGGVTTEQAIRAVREICSHDNEMQVKTWIPRWLVIPEALHGLGLIDDMERASFVVEQRGEQMAIDLKPVSIFEAEKNWVNARDKAAPPPLWLKDPQNLYWFEYLADSKTVYVQYNAVSEKKDETIADFAKRLFAFVEANPVDRFVLDIFLKQGMEAAIRHYREFKADPMNAYADRVWPLRLVGRRLMNVHKRFPDAIEFFKFNVVEHPRSDMALFVLGDAYERTGDVKQAIENYEKSLALNPKNWELVDQLKALREKQGRSGQ
jgi:tetratricopeptide (TPR) repeat protein